MASDPNGRATVPAMPTDFPITISVVVTPPGGKPLPAVFFVHLPVDDTLAGNLNPELRGMVVTSRLPDRGDGGVASLDAGDDGGGILDAAGPGGEDAGLPADAPGQGPPPGLRLDDLGTVTLPMGQQQWLRLDIPVTSAEPLARPATSDFVPDIGLLQYEHLSFYWYLQSGDLYYPTTGYLPDPRLDSSALLAAFAEAASNKWTVFGSYYGKSTVRIIVVARDSRDGVAWTTGTVTVGQPR